MQRRVDAPLFKYNLVFFATYIGLPMAFGILARIVGFHVSMTVNMILGLLLPSLAAWFALNAFVRDNGRGLDDSERARLMRVQLVAMAVLATLGVMLLRALYNKSLLGMFQPMSMAYVLVAPFITALFGFGQLSLVYTWLNGRHAAAPASGPAAAQSRNAPRVRVLVVGGGAAAHALAWKLGQSPRVLEVLVANGNAGIAGTMRCRNVVIDLADVEATVAMIRREGVALTVVPGAHPELVARLHALDLPVVGAGKAALELAADATAVAQFAQRHALSLADPASAGAEVDLVALADGSIAVLLAAVQVDGAMRVSPAPALAGAQQVRAVREMLVPAMQGLVKDNTACAGFLQLRLRVGDNGVIRLAGMVAGLDDVAAPAWILRQQSDLFDLLFSATDYALDSASPRTNPRASCAQAMVAVDARLRDATVSGLDVRPPMGSQIFQGATRPLGNAVVASGTHVLSACSLGDTAQEAAMATRDVIAALALVPRAPAAATA
jgi:phosphoribosylamine-glycine ligase